MNALTKVLLFLCAVFATVLLIRHGDRALHASTPQDMPADSRFFQTSFDVRRNEAKGEWIACRVDAATASDWCRVTDARGIVVFEGDFTPLSRPTPLPNSQLKVAVQPGANRLWVEGPAESAPVPVIPLESGDWLVPSQDRDALLDRWASNPQELRQLQGF